MDREIDPELCDIDFSQLKLDNKPFSDGAYSKVFKATYRNEVVCAKLIPKDMDKDDELFHLYVEREIQVSKVLDHPNVVKHYGAGQDDKYYYLLTEFVPGGNLRSFIKHHRNLSWDLKVHIATGVAQGLQYMHSKNVLHRDIKSENFLVGDNWQIKICDFGFAKIINGDITKKAAHSICGTEEYMAPEMLMGLDYNDKVDIFSYGIFLAELITQCYLPTDLVRTPANQFGLNEITFKELLPPDCPLPLAELVIDCCTWVSHNRPSLERIVHKLYDIRTVLPLFNHSGNPSVQDPAETHRRKTAKNLPEPKQEEIKISQIITKGDDMDLEEESEDEDKIVFEEIKFEEFHELQPHEIHDLSDDELQPEELIVHELQEDELQEHEDNLHEVQELHAHGRDESLAEADLQVHELQPEFVEFQVNGEPLEEEDWADYETITTTHVKGHKEEGTEEDEDLPEMQFCEFRVSVVDYVESNEHVSKSQRAEGLLTPRRPALQQRGGGTTLQKPILQHWESRELLENKLEREFRLAREFVRARELPALPPSPKQEIRSPKEENPSPNPEPDAVLDPKPELEPEPEPELELESAESGHDLDLDLDMEGLQMESFIVFEYPEEEREENSFNFADTYTSKSAKYSVYYH